MAKQTRRSKSSTRSRGQKKAPGLQLTDAQRNWIMGLFLLAVSLLTFLSLLPQNRGSLTDWWLRVLRYLFGWGIYVVPVGLAALGLWVITTDTEHPLAPSWSRTLGLLSLFISGLSLSHHFVEQPQQALAEGYGGGYIGYWLSRLLSGALGWAGATVVFVTLIGVGLVLALDVSLSEVIADFVETIGRIVAWLGERRPRWHKSRPSHLQLPAIPRPASRPVMPHSSNSVAVERAIPGGQQSAQKPIIGVDMTPTMMSEATHQWALPQVESILVESEEAPISVSEIKAKARIIEETLHSLGVPVTVVEVNPGPVVTQFGLEPGYTERRDRQGKVKRVKVKVSRIAALSNDLALALAASPIRIETPVPGKAIVGLEVPNNEIETVGLRGVIESEQFRLLSSGLAIALGRDVSGTAVVDDLTRLPHLLIAGATGSGKSVCINALITCLLCRNSPEDLKLLMIDPKRVELSIYNGTPHLIAPVIVEAARVVGVLHWVTREMERRYKVLAKVGARNIQSLNEMASARGEAKMPYIVVFIDELADLMMVAPEQIERLVCRIAQMARATGIHLVIATQRPSVDVVTGLIKANFPARLSFAVSSQVDSRVVIDTPGADKLLGRGDALYMAPDSPKLIRIQGCYVSDAELANLVNFWRGQIAKDTASQAPRSLHEIVDTPLVQRPLWPDMRKPKPEQDERDPLLNEAIDLVVAAQRASVSFLQRRLRVGYSRAARLIDILEEEGIVGPATGTSKPREVLRKPPGEKTPDE